MKLAPLRTCLATAVAVLAMAAPAHAAGTDPTTEVTEVDPSGFPKIRAEFTSDSTDPGVPEIIVEENGVQVPRVTTCTGRLGHCEDEPRNSVMLVIDTSQSMAGEKLDEAVAAGETFLAQARPDDSVGIMTFNGEVTLLQAPTTDRAAVRAALDEVKIGPKTRMYDAVLEASAAFPRAATSKVIVVLSDGSDFGSTASASAAGNAARTAGVEVHGVAIRSNKHPQALQDLTVRTGGSFGIVRSADELGERFDRLGRELLRSWWIEYESRQATGEAVRVEVQIGSWDPLVTNYDSPKVANAEGLGTHISAAPRVATEDPMVRLPAGRDGAILAALPFALIIALLSWTLLERRSRLNVAARIAPFVEGASTKSAEADGSDGALRSITRPLVGVVDSLLGRSSFFRKVRFLGEQANIPIRPAELAVGMLVAAFLGLFMAFTLGGGNLLLLVGAPVLLGLSPYLWLKYKARKRRRRFESQLADVLGGISSSLRAGHAFNQALAGIAKDAPAPTNEEFQRVMTETRLGLPIEVALDAMAVRMGSPDFEFAVTTVNIQRTVGGSLADILEMVGDTVRNRQQFRKKVKALTSMGTMSAYVLLGMPAFLGLVLTVMSPDYMKPMFATQQGHILMAIGAFSMFLGYLACMKIVKVKV